MHLLRTDLHNYKIDIKYVQVHVHLTLKLIFCSTNQFWSTVRISYAIIYKRAACDSLPIYIIIGRSGIVCNLVRPIGKYIIIDIKFSN
jgi:hypothetical protein